jgi:AcrR family transcriptional regulator
MAKTVTKVALPSALSDVRRAPGRPKNEGIETALLDAAAGLLRENGFGGCSIEAVSRRSGIGKPAIYRRWPNRTALAIDAFARVMATEVPLIETGDAAQDLVDDFVRLAEHYSGPDGRLYVELIASAVLEPGAAQLLYDRFFAQRRRELVALWRRGVDCGQFRADVDPDDAIDLIFGAGIFRLLIGHAPMDTQAARRLAETALIGLVGHERPRS